MPRVFLVLGNGYYLSVPGTRYLGRLYGIVWGLMYSFAGQNKRSYFVISCIFFMLYNRVHAAENYVNIDFRHLYEYYSEIVNRDFRIFSYYDGTFKVFFFY